jgi:hypothetical protein
LFPSLHPLTHPFIYPFIYLHLSPSFYEYTGRWSYSLNPVVLSTLPLTASLGQVNYHHHHYYHYHHYHHYYHIDLTGSVQLVHVNAGDLMADYQVIRQLELDGLFELLWSN